MLRTVAAVKGWRVEERWEADGAARAVGCVDGDRDGNGHGDTDTDRDRDRDEDQGTRWGAVRRLEENWKLFERGGHRPYAKRRQRRDRAIEEWEEANEGGD